MMNLTPFLLFDGDCAVAMTFYQSCLGGELTITRFGDTPRKGQMPTEQHHNVTHASLKVAPSRFLLRTDYIPREHRDRLILSPCILASDELKAVFDNLAVGASKEPLDDLRDMPFGSYGHLADKYGVHWFFQGDKAAVRSSLMRHPRD